MRAPGAKPFVPSGPRAMRSMARARRSKAPLASAPLPPPSAGATAAALPSAMPTPLRRFRSVHDEGLPLNWTGGEAETTPPPALLEPPAAIAEESAASAVICPPAAGELLAGDTKRRASQLRSLLSRGPPPKDEDALTSPLERSPNDPTRVHVALSDPDAPCSRGDFSLPTLSVRGRRPPAIWIGLLPPTPPSVAGAGGPTAMYLSSPTP